ncbi:hypothetical protein GYA49_04365, partial [Candidatus Beckwithbacteria bacterium]|nr:hypothetical protein [Candidatus Beckwithbacteria bacterium]
AGNITAQGASFDSLTTHDATVSGSLFASLIEAEDGLTVNLGTTSNATDSANTKFSVLANNEEVAAIDASGSGKLRKLIIADAKEATTSGVVGNPIDPTVTSNATAGTAVIPAGETMLIIENSNVTPGSLVYITPTSDTGNNVLFVKQKVEQSETQTGSFTVALSKKHNADVTFNWWIIN